MSTIKWFAIKLNIKIDDLETTSVHVLQAESEKDAINMSFDAECHDENPEIDGNTCRDIDFIYKAFSVKEISEEYALIYLEVVKTKF